MGYNHYSSRPSYLHMAQFPQASFLLSAWQPQQFPPDQGAEVAFAGRSNAGKSSALNSLVGRKDLARTSKTPGRTQLINFFALTAGARLVDLPGYGYAKVPQAMQEHWRELLTGYVRSRHSLKGIVVIVDARRGLGDYDQQLLELLSAAAIPLHVVLTKADKLSRNEAAQTLRRATTDLGPRATAQLFSAIDGSGLEELRRTVLAMLRR
jgi:GTP-binding protein